MTLNIKPIVVKEAGRQVVKWVAMDAAGKTHFVQRRLKLVILTVTEAGYKVGTIYCD